MTYTCPSCPLREIIFHIGLRNSQYPCGVELSHADAADFSRLFLFINAITQKFHGLLCRTEESVESVLLSKNR